ncbi:RNA-binding protein [Schizosaccharomyces cryophilus OY26]|uniref:RNA-binding protein n=1 Tax=Schizosaccharomyces cryophilus (strain OY26 / ATCC MYA-4695 / CBS 11777 / NBRC 106824 / NRRL Y48691) TaxID=653667 RepID=S9X2E0_SCHCR|nr:RNA-binding protein [Schizosaccharomyces cryophilus OY26]EPY51267.1 RNA-binding protein [Schizosaccharomyces cryophilus OY26]
MAKRGKSRKNSDAPLSLGRHTIGGRVGKKNDKKTDSGTTESKTSFSKRVAKELKNNELFQRLNSAGKQETNASPQASQKNLFNRVQAPLKASSSPPSSVLANGSISIRGTAGPTTVAIENLAPGTSSEDVSATLQRFGEISQCQVFDTQGKVRASVKFTTFSNAQQVVQQLDGVTADGRKLSCYIKKNKPKKGKNKLKKFSCSCEIISSLNLSRCFNQMKVICLYASS